MDEGTFKRLSAKIYGKDCDDGPVADCISCPFLFLRSNPGCRSVTRDPIIDAYREGKIALVDGVLMEGVDDS